MEHGVEQRRRACRRNNDLERFGRKLTELVEEGEGLKEDYVGTYLLCGDMLELFGCAIKNKSTEEHKSGN